MTDDQLENLVHELRTTLSESEGLDDDDRERLETLARRIESRLVVDGDLDDNEDDEHEGIVDHIGDSVSLFETDHPDLVRTLNRIAQTLNAAGI